MKKFEYYVDTVDPMDATRTLNRRGEEGWELVTVIVGDTFWKPIFKREKQSGYKELRLVVSNM